MKLNRLKRYEANKDTAKNAAVKWSLEKSVDRLNARKEDEHKQSEMAKLAGNPVYLHQACSTEIPRKYCLHGRTKKSVERLSTSRMKNTPKFNDEALHSFRNKILQNRAQ